uniref:Calmodulin-lysine N-methyltransferase n=1 Tax=Tetraselmis chuii TaxID=63592 RepID=A0A7S1T3C5_9CHLO
MVAVLEVNAEMNFPKGLLQEGSSAACDLGHGTVSCHAQKWGEPLIGGPYDLVIGADIVYMDGSFDPLVCTMVQAAAAGAAVVFAYAPQRGDAPSFWDEEPSSRFMDAVEAHFDVEVLQADIQPLPEDKAVAPFGHDTAIWIYNFALRSL